MPTFFWKIFLSFWLVVIVFSLYVIVFLKRPAETSWQNVTRDAFAIYARGLVDVYERGGPVRVQRDLQQLPGAAYDQAFLLNASGNDVTGQTLPAEAAGVAAKTSPDGEVELVTAGGRSFLAQHLTGHRGANYIAVATISHAPGPPPPPTPLRDLFIAVTISGLVCFGLAKYLAAPINQLRNAAQRLASGNLTARAGRQLGRRRDEMAQLVNDFDLMAAKIESLMQAQKRLIGDLSHEFRSPITRINLAVELIREVDISAVTMAIARIEQETERLNAMVGSMLALSRADAVESLMDRSPIQLGKLLRKVVTDTDFEARDRKCHVVLSASEECIASGDPGLLRSAVENVIRNAIRYTSAGTEVEVRLGYENAKGSHLAVIRIRDHGPGVPESALEQLFLPFFRLDESRERSTGGAGLGLAIARRAAQLHGGAIRAENCPSGGLEVTITLPATSVACPSLAGS